MIVITGQDDKRTLLLEAAIKRFSHFGIAKTTLSEIADDAHISKANLYYYFPDKWSIVEAIVDLLISQSSAKFQKVLKKHSSVEQRLQRMLDIRMAYFQKYRLLIRNLSEVNVHEPRIRALSNRLFEEERNNIATILQEGINLGELETLDIESVSKLYITTMRGLSMYTIYSDPSPLIGVESLELMHQHQSQLNQIFFRGISNNQNKNK